MGSKGGRSLENPHEIHNKNKQLEKQRLHFHAEHDQYSYHTKSTKGNSMKVKTILHKLLEDVTPNMHKVRRKSINTLVSSLISGAHNQWSRHLKSVANLK